MALEQTTLTNSAAGTVTTTSNSHDGNTGTSDDVTVQNGSPETFQWGFDGAPLDWKKTRIQALPLGNGDYTGSAELYVIPAGESDPGSYTLVKQWTNVSDNVAFDETYEHGSTISADGIYLKVIGAAEGGATVKVQEMDCWHEPSVGGGGTGTIGPVSGPSQVGPVKEPAQIGPVAQ